MRAGDLVIYRGSWSPSMAEPKPETGVIMTVWTNGRTRQIMSADILWDNGSIGQAPAHLLGVISESR